MYCPSCAKPVKDGLKYCNNCGAKIAAGIDDAHAKMLDDLLETLFWTAILGLGILIGLIAVMLYRQVQPELVAVVSVVYLATVGTICFMLNRQVSKLVDAKLRILGTSTDAGNAPQLKGQTTAQLDEFREPANSITERTTKDLDKVRRG